MSHSDKQMNGTCYLFTRWFWIEKRLKEANDRIYYWKKSASHVASFQLANRNDKRLAQLSLRVSRRSRITCSENKLCRWQYRYFDDFYFSRVIVKWQNKIWGKIDKKYSCEAKGKQNHLLSAGKIFWRNTFRSSFEDCARVSSSWFNQLFGKFRDWETRISWVHTIQPNKMFFSKSFHSKDPKNFPMKNIIIELFTSPWRRTENTIFLATTATTTTDFDNRILKRAIIAETLQTPFFHFVSMFMSFDAMKANTGFYRRNLMNRLFDTFVAGNSLLSTLSRSNAFVSEYKNLELPTWMDNDTRPELRILRESFNAVSITDIWRERDTRCYE